MTIRPTKFYKPRQLARPAKLEREYAKEVLFSLDDHKSGALFDVVLREDFMPRMSRRIAMSNLGQTKAPDAGLIDKNDYQITYHFSSKIRNNVFAVLKSLSGNTKITGEYGDKGWSFRMLYEFLCEVFNGGVPFIDTYFDRVFKSRPIYNEFQEIWEDIQDDLNNAIYNENPRTVKGWFKKLTVSKSAIREARCRLLAEKIRNDIEECLRSGRLPLRGRRGATISKASQKIREQFIGMAHYKRLFYASGSLIRDLNITVEVGERAA